MNAVIEIINVLAQKIVEPEFLINLTLKTSLILAFTGLLNVLLQGASASVRHWFWSLAFVGVLLFPCFRQPCRCGSSRFCQLF